MASWLTFFKERVPLTSFSFSSAGIALSSAVVATGKVSFSALWAFLGVFLFFITLRVMDDLKDVAKDRIAHPMRTIARGVLGTKEVKTGVQVLLGVQIALALSFRFTLSATATLSYLVLTFYLWLMYHEFFVGSWLQERPLTYALTHQIVIIPCTAFAIAASNPKVIFTLETFALCAFFFGGFFAYEVGRKFDPKADPVLNTYRHVYGARVATLFMTAAMIVSMGGALVLGILWVTLSVQMLCAIVPVTIATGAPRAYKSVELIATLNLAFLLWAPMVLWGG